MAIRMNGIEFDTVKELLEYKSSLDNGNDKPTPKFEEELYYKGEETPKVKRNRIYYGTGRRFN